MFKNNRCCAENFANNNFNATASFDGMDNSMNMNFDMNMGMGMDFQGPCCPNPCNNVNMCPPIMECPQERVCHRTINYEVPHMIPCHTKMINHHVYHHSYAPCFSYSEEDEYSNVYENRCC